MYDSIHRLSLGRFINCLADGRLIDLVIRGKASEKQLTEAWGKIIDEYLFCLSDTKDKYAMNLTRDIYLMEYNIHRVALMQKYLFYRNDPAMAQDLIGMGVISLPWPEDVKGQGVWLTNVTATIKRWIATVETKKAELKRVQPDFTSQKPDRKYFNDMLTILSKHCGYHIDEHQTTTGRYVSILLQYREYIKQAEKQINSR